MTQFKGTKGKWGVTKSTPNGYSVLKNDIEIASDDWSVACAFNDIEEGKYNALLISKAPEILNDLNDLVWLIDNSATYEELRERIKYSKQLIKEATEL
jgi:hypothetical protein